MSRPNLPMQPTVPAGACRDEIRKNFGERLIYPEVRARVNRSSGVQVVFKWCSSGVLDGSYAVVPAREAPSYYRSANRRESPVSQQDAIERLHVLAVGRKGMLANEIVGEVALARFVGVEGPDQPIGGREDEVARANKDCAAAPQSPCVLRHS